MKARIALLVPSVFSFFVAAAPPAQAQSESSKNIAEIVQRGNEALANGKYQEALSAYDEAKAANPEMPEVAYNRGISLYRLGQFDAAQRALQDALKPDRPDLEARVKYNLGRSAHESAIEGRDKLEEAVNSLGKAVSFYKDALALNPKDDDARRNLEQADRLRAFLEQKLKEQQQQKKNPTSQPSSQPSEKPTSQPDEQKQPSSQPSSQPNDQKDQKDQQGQQGDEKQDDQQGEQKQDKQKEGKKDDKGKSGKKDGASEEGDEKKQEEGQSADEDQEKQMKMEEVEPMLQEARDAEKARHEAKRAKMMRLRGKIPVSKDW